MPRQLALGLCVGFIVWLFRSDMKLRRLPSLALWVPAIWLAVVSSRPLPLWLLGGADQASAAAAEGSTINIFVQGSLIVASLVILQRRAFDWERFLRSNKAIVAIYLYFTLSAFWSYYPFASVKRICRDFGTVLMVLVIVTESDPFASARLIFVRVSYLVFPLSVLFIKYYPEYGCSYSESWERMYTGVAMHKNTLGAVVMVFGMFLVCDMMEPLSNGEPTIPNRALVIRFMLLLMGSWLLMMSNSKTSLVCVILGGIVFWATRYLLKLQSPGRMAAACVAVVLVLAAVESAFSVSAGVIHALGRKEDLTGRTAIWEMVMEQPINPVIGYGFMGFWDGPLGQAYHETSGTHLVSTHNGYLETYVDGGTVGLILLLILLLSGGQKSMRDLLAGGLFGKIKFVFLVIAIVNNYSESSYFRLSTLWFVLLLAVISCPASRVISSEQGRSDWDHLSRDTGCLSGPSPGGSASVGSFAA